MSPLGLRQNQSIGERPLDTPLCPQTASPGSALCRVGHNTRGGALTTPQVGGEVAASPRGPRRGREVAARWKGRKGSPSGADGRPGLGGAKRLHGASVPDGQNTP